MPPNSPEQNALITRFRETYSSVNMSRDLRVKKIEEIKQLVEFRQCTNTAFERKNASFVFLRFTWQYRSTSYLMWHSKVSFDCLL